MFYEGNEVLLLGMWVVSGKGRRENAGYGKQGLMNRISGFESQCISAFGKNEESRAGGCRGCQFAKDRKEGKIIVIRFENLIDKNDTGNINLFLL